MRHVVSYLDLASVVSFTSTSRHFWSHCPAFDEIWACLYSAAFFHNHQDAVATDSFEETLRHTWPSGAGT